MEGRRGVSVSVRRFPGRIGGLGFFSGFGGFGV